LVELNVDVFVCVIVLELVLEEDIVFEVDTLEVSVFVFICVFVILLVNDE
jgi:hypothetical protein